MTTMTMTITTTTTTTNADENDKIPIVMSWWSGYGSGEETTMDPPTCPTQDDNNNNDWFNSPCLDQSLSSKILCYYMNTTMTTTL